MEGWVRAIGEPTVVTRESRERWTMVDGRWSMKCDYCRFQ
jgi:hypothetical protein